MSKIREYKNEESESPLGRLVDRLNRSGIEAFRSTQLLAIFEGGFITVVGDGLCIVHFDILTNHAHIYRVLKTFNGLDKWVVSGDPATILEREEGYRIVFGPKALKQVAHTILSQNDGEIFEGSSDIIN